MKKFALRGFAILLITLIGCFFFSGTIKMLTTAKVMLIFPNHGKLKEQISLIGYLTFSETEGIRMASGNEGSAFPIKRIHVTKGSYVKAGDVLFEIDTSGLNTTITEYETTYQNAQKELLALERQYANLRITRTDQDWLNAYDALLAAKDASYEAHIHLDVVVQGLGVELGDEEFPEGTDGEKLTAAQEAADLADTNVVKAQTAMNKAARFEISEDAYQYTMRRRELETKMNQAYDSLVAQRSLQACQGVITADHDGYILDVKISEEEVWDGSSAAVIMSAQNATCFLRARLPENTRSLTVDTQVMLAGLDSVQLKTRISAVGYNANGEPIIDASLKASDIATLGTAYGLLNNGIRMTINYVAPSSSLLIPVSAVRGNGADRYVFAVTENRNSFGQAIYVIEKKEVTILDETSEYVSVSSASDVGCIAYMEDRSISEGSEVIPYE